MSVFQPLFLLQLVKSLPFYIPPAWKRYPFRAEPHRTVHYREYPPPPPPHRVAGLTSVKRTDVHVTRTFLFVGGGGGVGDSGVRGVVTGSWCKLVTKYTAHPQSNWKVNFQRTTLRVHAYDTSLVHWDSLTCFCWFNKDQIANFKCNIKVHQGIYKRKMCCKTQSKLVSQSIYVMRDLRLRNWRGILIPISNFRKISLKFVN